MIFSEMYGAYYAAVAKILTCAVKGTLSDEEMRKIILENAFSESILSIFPALKSGEWQLLTPENETPLLHIPSMPLTTLQKRWLKAIMANRRMALFGVQPELDGDIEPLFTEEDYFVFDRYADGDNFSDPAYQKHFQLILEAIREKQPLKIVMQNRKKRPVEMHVLPLKLEYSEKDDKFRLLTEGCRYGGTINLGRILSCARYFGAAIGERGEGKEKERSLVLDLLNERNALERAMLHFAHFKKEAVRLEENSYRITVFYDRNDEMEMVIRVLSFGPFLRVVSPKSFVDLIKERLQKQKNCGLF